MRLFAPDRSSVKLRRHSIAAVKLRDADIAVMGLLPKKGPYSGQAHLVDAESLDALLPASGAAFGYWRATLSRCPSEACLAQRSEGALIFDLGASRLLLRYRSSSRFYPWPGMEVEPEAPGYPLRKYDIPGSLGRSMGRHQRVTVLRRCARSVLKARCTL